MKPNPLYLIPAAFMTAAMLPLLPLAIALRYLNDQPPQAHFPSIRCPACGECNCDECIRLRNEWKRRNFGLNYSRPISPRDQAQAAACGELESWRKKIREMRERFRS